jgi:hypothetical protein
MTTDLQPTNGAAELTASYSQLTTHRKCPQAWNYGYHRGLTRAESEEAKVELEFGNWWHMLRAADSLARGRRWDSLHHVPRRLRSVDGGPELPNTATPVEVGELAERWWHGLAEEVKASWLERIGTTLPDRLNTLDGRWRDEHQEEIAAERPLAVEMRWRRRLPSRVDDDSTMAASLVGYVDEVYLDSRRQLVVARDHKTAKALGTQSTADDLMDSQLQLYAWGASPTVSSWGVGQIRATSYDRVRAMAPHPPSLTLAGRLSQRAGEPSLSSVDLETYLAWCRDGVPYPGTKKDGSGAGIYLPEQTVIDKLSTPAARSVWMQRTLTPLSTNLIRAHLRAAVDTVADLRKSQARVEVDGAAGRNFTSQCRWCDFVRLCRAELVGGVGEDYDLAELGLRKVERRSAATVPEPAEVVA